MNDNMKDIMKLARIELVIIPIFIFFKYIRPTVLNSASPEFLKITLLSLPNFFQAVIGTLTLTEVGLIINDRLNKKYQIKTKLIYQLAVLLTGILVVSQEMNIINIRTNATMDPNDLIFSAIGLIVGFWIILAVRPRIHNNAINP